MSKRFTSLILAAFGIAAMFTMATSATAAPASSNVPAPSVEVPVGSGGVSASADDPCYQVWMANVGTWLPKPAACNNEGAGTEGESRAIEALAAWSGAGVLCLAGHVQNIGDQGEICERYVNGVRYAASAGTTGQSLRLEGVHVRSKGAPICATAYVQDIGWQQERCGQEVWVGTSGEGKRMEKIRIHF